MIAMRWRQNFDILKYLDSKKKKKKKKKRIQEKHNFIFEISTLKIDNNSGWYQYNKNFVEQCNDMLLLQDQYMNASIPRTVCLLFVVVDWQRSGQMTEASG